MVKSNDQTHIQPAMFLPDQTGPVSQIDPTLVDPSLTLHAPSTRAILGEKALRGAQLPPLSTGESDTLKVDKGNTRRDQELNAAFSQAYKQTFGSRSRK